MSRSKKRRGGGKRPRPYMSAETALDLVPDNIGEGAQMCMAAEMADMDYDEFCMELERGGPAFIRLLPTVRKPMVAAVDGLAVGIGTTMLFHCDMVYASSLASFRTPFVDLALVPEAGSSLLAVRYMGMQRAFELLCLGEPFDALRAQQAGFVNHVVASGELEAAALKAAARLAQKPPGALMAARRLLRGDPAAILAQIEAETAVFAERLASAEAKEAFSAFFEKRKPDFARFREKD